MKDFFSKGNLFAVLACLLVIGVGYAFLGTVEDDRADMLTEPVGYKEQDATVEVGVVPESQEMLISAEAAPEPEETEEPVEAEEEAPTSPYAPTGDEYAEEPYETLPEGTEDFPEESYEELPTDEYTEEAFPEEEYVEEPVAEEPIVQEPEVSKRDEVIKWAEEGVGVPYVYGGNTPRGWDSSGYVQWVFAQAGIDLPRGSTAQAQVDFGTVIPESEAQRGDLVYMPGHIGIYAGHHLMYDNGGPKWGTSLRGYDWMHDIEFIRVID